MAVTWKVVSLDATKTVGSLSDVVTTVHWTASDSETVGSGDSAVVHNGSSYGSVGLADADSKSFTAYKDIKEAADALTDILYVTYGAGHAFGINLDKCFNEVQNSNMSKLGVDGKPIYNEKGKVMKGPNYFKPNLNKFVA